MRGEGAKAKVLLGCVCAALLAAGYWTARAIVPARAAATSALSLSVPGVATIGVPLSTIGAPTVSVASISVLPTTSTPTLPSTSTLAPPTVSTPSVPVTSVPSVPTKSVPTLPTTSAPVLPTSAPVTPAVVAGGPAQQPEHGGSGAASAGGRAASNAQQASSSAVLHRATSERAAGSGGGQARRHSGAGGGSGAGGPAGTPAPSAGRLAALLPARRVASRTPSAAHHSESVLSQIGRALPLPLPVPDWSKPIIAALLLLALGLGARSRVSLLRARRLERQREVLMRDLGVMQAALVPAVPAQLGGLAVSVAYRPAEGPAAGGDFYDLFATESGKVAFMLGDVAGHGPEALSRAALTRYTLRAYLRADMEPRAAVALAGRVLIDPAGWQYATVAVGVYDPKSGLLTYSLAGHPPPILLGFDAREPLTCCSSPPIGLNMATGLRQTVLSLPVGARACFFSDGLVEARSGGELLGRERLAEMVAALGPRPEAAVVLEQVQTAAQVLHDDMVALVLSPRTGAVTSRVHVEELEVDAHALRGAEVVRFLEGCRLAAPDIARTIELADAVVASRGTALLRARLDAEGATATVHEPRADEQALSPVGSARSSG
jgi:hypothetical protein